LADHCATSKIWLGHASLNSLFEKEAATRVHSGLPPQLGALIMVGTSGFIASQSNCPQLLKANQSQRAA